MQNVYGLNLTAFARAFCRVGSFWKTNPKSRVLWGPLMANTAVLVRYFGAEMTTSMSPDK
jgi:hypothetical protein